MKLYNVTILGAGKKTYTVEATSRARAVKYAVEWHDRGAKGERKTNGQKDKVGWQLSIFVVRES